MNLRALYLATSVLVILGLSPAFSQLRRPGFVTVEREDRTKSRLNQEKGAIYLEGMVVDEVKVRVEKPVAAYSTLTGDRWLGTLFDNQNAVLLAVSERAYRVRGQAKQGQIAGWVSKAAISGLPADFELKLKAFYERHQVVEKLIENKQVALGMTVEEVIASIGPPDRRSSKITPAGRSDTLEFISYDRVPQTTIIYDSFGRAIPSTQYIEVESGRVEIEFTNNAVQSISESEGIEMGEGGGYRIVPPPIFLF